MNPKTPMKHDFENQLFRASFLESLFYHFSKYSADRCDDVVLVKAYGRISLRTSVWVVIVAREEIVIVLLVIFRGAEAISFALKILCRTLITKD